MRAFVGFFVPEQVKDYVAGLQSSVANLPISCKMVEGDNIHVCLSFLGNVPEENVDGLKAKLTEICSSHKKFEVVLGSVVPIPNESHVRVIVLGVSDPSGTLKEICSEIKESIGGDMKPPHLTLCRVRNILDKDKALRGIKNLIVSDQRFTVSSISLIESALSRSGPIYNTSHKAELL